MNIDFTPTNPAEAAEAQERFRTLVASAPVASNEDKLRASTAQLRLELFDEAQRRLESGHKSWKPARPDVAAVWDLDLWRACAAWWRDRRAVARMALEARDQDLWLHGSEPTPTPIDQLPKQERIGAIYEDRRRYLAFAAGQDPDRPLSGFMEAEMLWTLPRQLLWAGALEYSLMAERIAGAVRFCLDTIVAAPAIPHLETLARVLGNLKSPERSAARTKALKAVLAAREEQSKGAKLRKSLLEIYEHAFRAEGGDPRELDGFTDGALRTALSRERKRKTQVRNKIQ